MGNENEIVCPSGNFIFLSNHPTIEMRNIPNDKAYFAVVIEFDYADFDQFKHTQKQTQNYLQGSINGVLIKALRQYIEWASDAPPETWHFRRQELLQLIYLSGYQDICTMVKPPSLSHQLHNIINHNIADEWPVERLAEQLAISDSTLRRKLKAEGTDIQTIRIQAKLNHALYLVQTTMEPIGRIAQHCGYDSQSRFTEKFKQLFGMTPTELRKTNTELKSFD
ncbi:helix-turn-helix transcriptional regulator [Neisseria sp. Ec49-e6-T10]|uniref:helix-turn-helix transcriptional regulator n=1 Tax=Neisseria sp. Ec49-e6-T10 TaxID=3140744 RepID=UPI003EBE0E57